MKYLKHTLIILSTSLLFACGGNKATNNPNPTPNPGGGGSSTNNWDWVSSLTHLEKTIYNDMYRVGGVSLKNEEIQTIVEYANNTQISNSRRVTGCEHGSVSSANYNVSKYGSPEYKTDPLIYTVSANFSNFYGVVIQSINDSECPSNVSSNYYHGSYKHFVNKEKEKTVTTYGSPSTEDSQPFIFHFYHSPILAAKGKVEVQYFNTPSRYSLVKAPQFDLYVAMSYPDEKIDRSAGELYESGTFLTPSTGANQARLTIKNLNMKIFYPNNFSPNKVKGSYEREVYPQTDDDIQVTLKLDNIDLNYGDLSGTWLEGKVNFTATSARGGSVFSANGYIKYTGYKKIIYQKLPDGSEKKVYSSGRIRYSREWSLFER